MGSIRLVLGVCVAAFALSEAHADLVWPPPVRTFSSADGLTQFRVTPSESSTEPAMGLVVQTDYQGQEKVLWETRLVNTPDRAFVANSGAVATVENYSHQWDQHAVVIYDAQGKMISDFPLNRFLTHQEVVDQKAANRESVRLWPESWTGACRFWIDDKTGEFVVEPPSGRTRHLSLTTGELAYRPARQGLQPPVITLTGLSPQNGTSLVFEVLNPNDAPLDYYGYTVNSFDPPIPAGMIWPLYTCEVEREGTWTRVELGHCKTGQGEVSIPARSVQKFLVHIGEVKEPTRYGLLWHNSGDGWTTETAWSPTITQADVDALRRN